MYPKAIHINIINVFTAKFIEKLTDMFGQSNLFFDDLKANVAGATSVGIQAIQVMGPHTLIDFFVDV
jgi:hypothetical protein